MTHNNEQQEGRGSLVSIDEASDRLSRLRISEMADVFRLSDEELDEKRIIYPKMRDARLLNVFRDLRTRLIEKSRGKNFTLLVTSVCEGGGGSFVCTNLAAAIALDQGKTALMVDCNMYSPSGDTILDESEVGFLDYLENPSLSIEEIIYATGIPRLRLIPIGRSKDMGPEYSSSYRMRQFIDELRSRYRDRYILLDVPSVGLTADARILAELADFVLVVVPYGKVTKEQINLALENIPREKLAGVVFNN